MTNTALNNNLRNVTLRDLIEFLASKYDVDVLGPVVRGV